MERTQSLLWPYGELSAEMDPALCAEELELAPLCAALFPGRSSEEALSDAWPLLTRHVPTLQSRVSIVEALYQNEALLRLLEECSASLFALEAAWDEYNACAEIAASSRTAAGLIGFVRGFEKITGRSTGGVIEGDAQRRDYYSNLFRSSYLGLRAAGLYFHSLQKLRSCALPEALGPLARAAERCWTEDKGQEASALLAHLEKEFPEPAAFSLEIGYSRDQRPASISVGEIHTGHYRRDSIFTAESWDGLSSTQRIPQLSGTESFRTLLLAELGSAQKSKLQKLQRELGKLSLSGVGALAAYADDLRFFTAAARFARRLAESGMPVSAPEYRENGPLAEISGLYLPVAALYQGPQITNDTHIGPSPDFSIITGANGSGKTAYLIAVGQAVWLGMLGGFLPAAKAVLSPPDMLCCLFAAGESETGEDSRMGLESARIAEIEAAATPASLVLMNEPLTSTAVSEAIDICADLIGAFCIKGVRGLMVTHYSEIYDAVHKALAEKQLTGTVKSLTAVSERRQEGIVHTYRIKEAPPVRSGYAAGVAKKYGVTLQDMLETLKQAGVDISAAERSAAHA